MANQIFAVQSELMKLASFVSDGTMAYFYSSLKAQEYADFLNESNQLASVVELTTDDVRKHLDFWDE